MAEIVELLLALLIRVWAVVNRKVALLLLIIENKAN